MVIGPLFAPFVPFLSAIDWKGRENDPPLNAAVRRVVETVEGLVKDVKAKVGKVVEVVENLIGGLVKDVKEKVGKVGKVVEDVEDLIGGRAEDVTVLAGKSVAKLDEIETKLIGVEVFLLGSRVVVDVVLVVVVRWKFGNELAPPPTAICRKLLGVGLIGDSG